ncbi:MAG: hypothetical protein JRN52_04135 [Nitrososphaerota archaeon]|nr:hypothetical protein [Nitrososphaerota archaeon]
MRATARQQVVTYQRFHIDHYEERQYYDLKCIWCGKPGSRSTLWHVEEGKLCDDCLTKYTNGFRKLLIPM